MKLLHHETPILSDTMLYDAYIVLRYVLEVSLRGVAPLTSLPSPF